jgi:gluconokinase
MRNDVTIVVMGVAGAGKTTIGVALAARLDLDFFDADLVHDADAREQMARGVPLTDAQRDAWIERVIAEIREGPARVVACSALRSDDRDRIRAARAVRFVLLDVPNAVLSRRLADRPAHFFPAALLDSQLARFEPPAPDEDVLVVDADRPIAEIVDELAVRFTR